ncbi:hypothetical protein Scep_026028 [Stephania cephalantha]|uniref:Uncharacterized protein n=1 Tax=Stephania cephalantha TaxID=152367 RepID=A0AAP0HPY5_9MAGN
MEDEGTMMRRRPCPEETICDDAREDERDETKQRLSLFRCTPETSTVGTRKGHSSQLLIQGWQHFSNSLGAPVLLGMLLNEAALPPLQSLLDGPSTVF